MVTVLGGLAEFDRDLTRARTGRAASAPRRRVRMGRPPKLTLHQREAIRRRDRGDDSLAEIGHGYNVSRATISRLAACLS